MQWRKHVRIKYGGRVGVGQGQRERKQVQLQVRVVQLQREGGARLSYVCHQPQLSSSARRSCSAAAMLCCGRRKVSATQCKTYTIDVSYMNRIHCRHGEKHDSISEALRKPDRSEYKFPYVFLCELCSIFLTDCLHMQQVDLLRRRKYQVSALSSTILKKCVKKKTSSILGPKNVFSILNFL